MSCFSKSGKVFRVVAKAGLDLHEQLPVGTYTILQGCDGSFFLQTIDSFEVKGKLYGNTARDAERILGTFLSRKNVSTGVLMAGEKGSGKSLLAKYLSICAADKGIATLVVNSNFCGEKFNTFLQAISQPVVVIFDEFEKVYQNPNEQEAMLTLLDGVHPSHKLFLLTCNDNSKIDNNMKNRPGRIFYLLDFDGLSQDFIREYCDDNLNNKDHIPLTCNIAALFQAFNFDMLKAMVEEMNRYNETPAQVLKFLNARPRLNGMGGSYKYSLTVNGVLTEDQWQGEPLKTRILLTFKKPNSPDVAEIHAITDAKARRAAMVDSFGRATFEARDLETMDAANGTFTFVNDEGHRLELVERKDSVCVDYDLLSGASMKSAIKPVGPTPPKNGKKSHSSRALQREMERYLYEMEGENWE